MPPRVITLCAWNRPDYLRQTLAALAQCCGIENYLLMAQVEPGCPAVHDQLAAVDFCACQVIQNQTRLGCNTNAEIVWARGFAVADFIVFVEEDILLAPDALLLLEHCRERYAADPTVFSCTAYLSNRLAPAPADYYALTRISWFLSWGCGLWRDRWARFAGQLAALAPDQMYDSFLAQRCQQQALWQIAPRLSRVRHIGVRSSLDPARGPSRIEPPYWALAYEPLPPGDYHES